MYYLGVDPSITNTGLVVLDSKMKVVRVAESNKTLKNSVVRNAKIERLKLLRDFLLDTIEDYSEIKAGYEDYSYQSINKSFTLGELGGVYKVALWERTEEEPLFVPPGKLKRFATGHGSASKDQMVAMAEREGFTGYSHDICDAYFLAKYAYYQAAPKETVKYEPNKKLLRSRLEVIYGGQ